MNKKVYSADDIKLVKQDERLVKQVDISRDGFKNNLIEAAGAARDFARTLVVNYLPEELRYEVNLNRSYRGGNSAEVIQSIDFALDENLVHECASPDDVVTLLWKNGAVPEWINVSVSSEDCGFTNIKLECCGRYSSKKHDMYHVREQRAPFHVLGPPAPSEANLYNEENKYDLYWER